MNCEGPNPEFPNKTKYGYLPASFKNSPTNATMIATGPKAIAYLGTLPFPRLILLQVLIEINTRNRIMDNFKAKSGATSNVDPAKPRIFEYNNGALLLKFTK